MKKDGHDMRVIPVSEMNPAPYNPRVELKPDDPEYQHIKNSLDSFGYLDPIVWNERTGNIVSGHQRYRILVDGGATELLVRVVDFDEGTEKACNLAMNKAVGLWDEEKLDALLEEMSGTPWDMSAFGFDLSEVERLGDGDGEGDDNGDSGFHYKEQYGVIVMCNSEQEQEEIYNRLVGEGFECKVVAT